MESSRRFSVCAISYHTFPTRKFVCAWSEKQFTQETRSISFPTSASGRGTCSLKTKVMLYKNTFASSLHPEDVAAPCSILVSLWCTHLNDKKGFVLVTSALKCDRRLQLKPFLVSIHFCLHSQPSLFLIASKCLRSLISAFRTHGTSADALQEGWDRYLVINNTIL